MSELTITELATAAGEISTMNSLVHTYIYLHGSTRAAIDALNSALGRHDELPRLYEWRDGRRHIPQPVQDQMVRECLLPVCRDLLNDQITHTDAVDMLTPPRRY